MWPLGTSDALKCRVFCECLEVCGRPTGVANAAAGGSDDFARAQAWCLGCCFLACRSGAPVLPRAASAISHYAPLHIPLSILSSLVDCRSVAVSPLLVVHQHTRSKAGVLTVDVHGQSMTSSCGVPVALSWHSLWFAFEGGGVLFGICSQAVATASGDKTLRLWSLAEGSCLRTLEGHTASVLRCSFLTSGTQVCRAATPPTIFSLSACWHGDLILCNFSAHLLSGAGSLTVA